MAQNDGEVTAPRPPTASQVLVEGNALRVSVGIQTAGAISTRVSAADDPRTATAAITWSMLTRRGEGWLGGQKISWITTLLLIAGADGVAHFLLALRWERRGRPQGRRERVSQTVRRTDRIPLEHQESDTKINAGGLEMRVRSDVTACPDLCSIRTSSP